MFRSCLCPGGGALVVAFGLNFDDVFSLTTFRLGDMSILCRSTETKRIFDMVMLANVFREELSLGCYAGAAAGDCC